MKIEQLLSCRFMIKLNHWKIKNEKEKITKFSKEPNEMIVFFLYTINH